MFAACNGTGSLPGTDCQMNGFNKESSYGGPSNPQYVYVPHSESKPYFDMAHEWVVGDNMFQSHLDESFVSHQYVIAAQAQSSVDLPTRTVGLRGRPGRRRYDYPESQPYGGTSKPVSITRRSATNSTRRSSVALLRGAVRQRPRRQRRNVVRLSGSQPHLQRSRLEEGR